MIFLEKLQIKAVTFKVSYINCIMHFKRFALSVDLHGKTQTTETVQSKQIEQRDSKDNVDKDSTDRMSGT